MYGLLRLLGLAAAWKWWTTTATAKALGRAGPAILAGIAALFALVVVSRILLTFDAIQSPEIRAVYAGFVVAIFGGFAAFLYYHYRRSTGPEKPTRQRLETLYGKHGVTPKSYGGPKPRRAFGTKSEGAISVVVCGLEGSGTHGVAAAMQAGLEKGALSRPVTFAEMPPLASSLDANREALEMARAADVVVFVADQDLRSYEAAFIREVLGAGQTVIVALDKADRMTPDQREDTKAAIAARFARDSVKPAVVTVISEPMPMRATVITADGEEREEMRTGPADVAAVFAHLRNYRATASAAS